MVKISAINPAHHTLSTLNGRAPKQSQSLLLRAFEDLQFFVEIENIQTEEFSNLSGKSAEALKRERRALVREKLGRGLSTAAEPVRLQRAIENLKREL